MSRKGFTLIELLVVIAIIAILAAILFPVFAQAKDSAKNSVLLSGVKQMGTSATMYAADYDDLFPVSMASSPNLPIDNAWQDICQPYMKNFDITTNIKRPSIAKSNPNYSWLRLQHFGIPARAVTNGTVYSTGYFSGTHNGLAVQYDGIAGFVNLSGGAAPDWMTPPRQVAASLSSSSVEDVSTTALIVEANNWDAWFSLTGADPLRTCARWTDSSGTGASNINGLNYGYVITATTRPKDGHNGSDGTQTGCNIADGRTTYVATDTSARSVDFRQYFYNGTPGKTAGVNVIKALNPTGK